MSYAPTSIRTPNLLVIGVSKAGTSSLFEYLGRHPDVGLADVKEVRYFDPIRSGGQLAPVTEYAAHFAGRDQRYAVEATPGYFYGGVELATAIQLICELPKVVVSLREPISRCWSWYRFEKSRLRLPRDISFDTYLDRCFALRMVGADSAPEAKPYWGVGGGCYDRWMAEWIEAFEDDLKIVFFDDLARDPEALMVDLFAWLDLDPQRAQLADLRAINATQDYRVASAQRIAVATNRRGERFFRHHSMIKRVARSGYYLLNRPKPVESMSASQRERLEAFYQPYNERLAEQLADVGVTLPWA